MSALVSFAGFYTVTHTLFWDLPGDVLAATALVLWLERRNTPIYPCWLLASADGSQTPSFGSTLDRHQQLSKCCVFGKSFRGFHELYSLYNCYVSNYT